MSMSILIVTAIAISAPVALYITVKRDIVQQYIGIVKNRFSTLSFGQGKRGSNEIEELRMELVKLKEQLEKYREKIDVLENRLQSLGERVELIDKRLTSFDTAPPDEGDDIVLKVVDLRRKGYSLKRIAEELDMPLSRVRKILKDNAVD